MSGDGRASISQVAKELREHPGNGAGERILVTGKGGAGKTTLTAALAMLFARGDRRVLAVDADPQQNLAYSLGYPIGSGDVVPITRELDYIEEKVGARPGEDWGLMLSLNPDVSDAVGRFGMHIRRNIDLLVIGSVVHPATGCLCPENSLLGAMVRHLSVRDDDVIIMDTQAGVEHFGRNLGEGFGTAIVVTEPSFNATRVAMHSGELAKEMGMSARLVVNKCRDRRDVDRVLRMVGDGFDSVHCMPHDPTLLDTEPDVTPWVESGCPYLDALEDLYSVLE